MGKGERATAADTRARAESTPSREENAAQPGRTVFSTPKLQGVATPKGGGAVRGMGEKFEMNAATGTASFSVPIATTPGRAGAELGLSLSYSTGGGNGPFGLGWSLSAPSITRRTEKRLPRYDETDVFQLAGAEDLVRVSSAREGAREITRYRPRTEGLFARVERVRESDGDEHWRVTTGDNQTHHYGRSRATRIVDPEDDARVFSWLLEETRDDRGNVTSYVYKGEDGAGVAHTLAEESRFAKDDPTRFVATAPRYLKRIRYANRKPFVADDFCYEVVFDYGEHDATHPRPDDDVRAAWAARTDATSSYRAGFEIRGYRLCKRVLMFHHFVELHPTEPTLVASTRFDHTTEGAVTYLTRVTHDGHVRDGDGYRTASLPSVEIDYRRSVLHDEVKTLGGEGAEALRRGFEGRVAQWQDLDGEGLPGLLVSEPHGWLYMRNEGGGALGAATPIRNLPAPHELGVGGLALADIDGDGRLEVSTHEAPLAGYFTRTTEGTFEPFRPFEALPRIDWSDPNLRYVDLDGDGHADALVTEDDVLVWYRSRGKAGFEAARWASKSRDERDGPAVVFDDGTESIHLADMTGDGLLDIVRIRNGEVCYWPNLGWARFGRRVTMEASPAFDSDDGFDPKRLRLFDVDGSGPTDIVYLGRSGATVFYNHAGARFAVGGVITTVPVHVPPEQISVTDLLGNGTACLLWTTPFERVAPIRYVDLMGGVKPHVLHTIDNNLGGRTVVEHASSTTFYLADRAAGAPWLTRLPFPVQVVTRVIHLDFVSQSRFTQRYAYHHGHFDGEERELGGFARVDVWDEESFHDRELSNDDAWGTPEDDSSASLRLAPTRTTTWFHTGAWLEQTKLEAALKREYGPRDENGRLDPLAPLLPDGPLHRDWSVRDEKEGARALRGKPLRQEVFAEDGSAIAHLPYAVTETSYEVRRLAPSGKGEDDFGIFLVVPDQSFSAHYERRTTDARIAHKITLETDAFGNVLDAVAIAYGRRSSALPTNDEVPGIVRANAAQRTDSIVRTLTHWTLPIDDLRGVRNPVPCEQRAYELSGLVPTAAYFTSQEIRDATTTLRAYASRASAAPQRRKVEHSRVIFRRDDLDGALPFGDAGIRALPFEEYQLALTPDVLAHFVRPNATGSEALIPDDTLLEACGYVPRAALVTEASFPTNLEAFDEQAGDWWARSGRVALSPGVDPSAFDAATVELAYAEEHFFWPCRQRDPFGHWSHLRYDPHHLLAVESLDALGNRTIAGTRHADGTIVYSVDYRVSQPTIVSDPNRNRTAIAFDALGLVVGVAVCGKPEGEPEGDTLLGFLPDVSASTLADLQDADDPRALAVSLLAGATARYIYDVEAFGRTRATGAASPSIVYAIARETHVADLSDGERTKVQLSITYTDGMSREIQKKLPAEPGPLTPGGPIVSPRWVGSSWVVLNNKGKPIRRYEPFFSSTHRLEPGRGEKISSTLLYDPIERVVAVLHPNHTWEKTTFSPWHQEVWDVSDTVLLDPLADSDVGHEFSKLPIGEVLPTWHAQRTNGALGSDEKRAADSAARHAGTPTTVHMDPLGRPVLSIAHNRYRTKAPDDVTVDELVGTFTDLDIEGFERAVWDAFDREVMRYDYDLRGRRIRVSSMEAGVRWTLADVADQVFAAWDSRGHDVLTDYDALRRPLRIRLSGQTGAPGEITTMLTEYGEGHPEAEALNLRGQVLRVLDTAGELRFIGRAKNATFDEAYDFKGQPIFARRRLAKDYKRLPNWPSDTLEDEVFQTETRTDALGRPRRAISADGSETRPTFNEAGLLERVDVAVKGGASTQFVRGIDYDAKGQRTHIAYGNDVTTSYRYDPLTYRLVELRTTRPNARYPEDRSEPGDADRRPVGLQYLSYVYDASGNIVGIRDDAQSTIFYAGDVTDGHAEFEYDALSQLRRARGREHIGQAGLPHATWNDEGRRNLAHPNDASAMRNYWQFYDYDKVGNIRELAHRAILSGDWTRSFRYEQASQLDASRVSNALSSTSLGTTHEFDYPHDVHGNMLAMAHLPRDLDKGQPGMVWDALDRLASSSRQSVTNGGTPETTYYTYDASGERVRKVTEGYAEAGAVPLRSDERIYLGSSEVYRKYAGSTPTPVLERETLHVMDDKQRIALVETRTIGTEDLPAQLTRYQFANHLGTAAIEVDDLADIVSYEEYHPYGTTAFHGRRNEKEAPKRYRYTGKERDDETGLSYHSARYYAPWLCRWTAADPEGLVDGTNIHAYVRSNPMGHIDSTGRQAAVQLARQGFDMAQQLLRLGVQAANDNKMLIGSSVAAAPVVGVGTVLLVVGGVAVTGLLIWGGVKLFRRRKEAKTFVPQVPMPESATPLEPVAKPPPASATLPPTRPPESGTIASGVSAPPALGTDDRRTDRDAIPKREAAPVKREEMNAMASNERSSIGKLNPAKVSGLVAKPSPRVSGKQVMGKTASQHAGKDGQEWLHVLGRAGGGSDVSHNLRTGTRDANLRMWDVERQDLRARKNGYVSFYELSVTDNNGIGVEARLSLTVGFHPLRMFKIVDDLKIDLQSPPTRLVGADNEFNLSFFRDAR